MNLEINLFTFRFHAFSEKVERHEVKAIMVYRHVIGNSSFVVETWSET